MKSILFFLIVFCSFSAYSQKDKKQKYDNGGYSMDGSNDEIQTPKKTNKIIVTNSLKSEENYLHVGKILVQNGYGLKTSNKDFGLFETAPRQMNRKKGWTGIFNIVVADSLITVSGQFCVPISMSFGSGVRSEPSYSEIKYMGKGLFDNSGFYEMLDLAKKFGNNIKYEIQ